MNGRVLIIEDDPVVIQSTSMVLETVGCEVSSGLGGQEGLAQIDMRTEIDGIIEAGLIRVLDLGIESHPGGHINAVGGGGLNVEGDEAGQKTGANPESFIIRAADQQ